MVRLILSLVLILGTASIGAQPVLRFGTVEGYEKWDAVLKEAYAALGIRAEAEVIPNARALLMIEQGTLDGLNVRSLNVPHPGTLAVPVPLRRQEVHAYTLGPDFVLKDPSVLKGHAVGAIRGSTSTQKFAEAAGAQLFVDNATLFHMLAEGRLEYVITPGPPSEALLQETKLTQSLVVLQPPLLVIEIGHIVLEKHRDLLPALTEQLKRLKAQGRFEEPAATPPR